MPITASIIFTARCDKPRCQSKVQFVCDRRRDFIAYMHQYGWKTNSRPHRILCKRHANE